MIDPYEHLNDDIDIDVDVDEAPNASASIEDVSQISSNIEEEFAKVGLRSSSLHTVSGALPDLYRFIGSVGGSFVPSPMDAAVARVLDEITEGSVSRYLAWYTAKRDILVLYVQKRGLEAIGRAVERVRRDLEEHNESYEAIRGVDHLMAHKDHLLNFINWQLNDACDAYTKHCERLGIEVDSNLLATGHLSSVDIYEEVYLKRPPRMSQFFDTSLIPETIFEEVFGPDENT